MPRIPPPPKMPIYRSAGGACFAVSPAPEAGTAPARARSLLPSQTAPSQTHRDLQERRESIPSSNWPSCPQQSTQRGQGDRHCTKTLVALITVAGVASSTSASYVPTTKPTKPMRLMATSLAMTRGCMPST